MRRGPALALWLGGLVAAFSMGSCSASDIPDTQIIRVPKHITHVKTETVRVQVPLPESCRIAVGYVDEASRESGNMTASAGHILNGLQELHKAVVMDDFNSINEMIQTVRDNEDTLGTAVVEHSIALDNARSTLAQCKEDMKGE